MNSSAAVTPDPGLEIIFSRCDLAHPLLREFHEAVRVFRERDQRGQRDHAGAPVDGPAPQASERPPAEMPEAKPDLASLVHRDAELVSPPDIFLQIEKVINDPRSSARQVAHIVSQDPGLSAKVLKIVNSAFFGFQQQIDTISRAVTILGTRELSSLALGTSVMSLFRESPSSLMHMGLFWEHSLACGICARLLAGFKNFQGLERFFISGLLHDVGKLIIFKYLPRWSEIVLRSVRDSDLFYYEVERQHLGFDHAQVGLALAEQWKLPTTLEQGLGRHHEALRVPPSAEAAVVSLADTIVNALGLGNSGERRISPDIIHIFEFLSLPVGIMENLVPLISRQIEETFHLFYSST
ncbi:MAG: HDOD domain-containing protein [Desulfobacterota bacterium]|nr:HDOD domain-containing protein [Thermodesulfobacteriota bacterium]